MPTQQLDARILEAIVALVDPHWARHCPKTPGSLGMWAVTHDFYLCGYDRAVIESIVAGIDVGPFQWLDYTREAHGTIYARWKRYRVRHADEYEWDRM